MKKENENRFLSLSIVFLISNHFISEVQCAPEVTTLQTEILRTTLIGFSDRLIATDSDEIEIYEQPIDRQSLVNGQNRTKKVKSIHSDKIDDLGEEDLKDFEEDEDISEQGQPTFINKTQPRRLHIDMTTNEEIIGPNDIDRLLADNDLNLDDDDDSDLDGILRAPGEECGRSRFDNDLPLTELTERIVGGNSVFEGEIPWIVSVRLKHPNLGQVGHWCSGVLISSSWVATASHCILNPLFHLPEAMFWEVRLGKHNISRNENNQKTYQTAKLFTIKYYSGYDNDLALLKLDGKVEMNRFISPICLPSHEHFDFSNAACYVSGWGKVDFNKKGSDVLQKVKVNIYDNIDCQRVYYPKFRIMIKNWHLCAGNKFGGKGTCHGDSGGPLQCRIKNRWYLAGVTSFGSNCAKYGFPDVFTKITYYLGWIREKMKNE